MSIVTADTDRWQVSTRSDGEVLTTSASVPGLEILLLGAVEGYRGDELTRWLESVARAVAEAAGEPPPGDPVPPLLREALHALLFSRAELWNRGIPPCAVALVSNGLRIGLGWVGEASVDVHHEGGHDDSEWVSVRDGEGREARAWCGAPGQDVRAELMWTPEESSDMVRLVAVWTPPPAAHAAQATQVLESPLAGPDAPDPGASHPIETIEPTPPGPDAPSAGVARWLEQHLRWSPGEPGRAETTVPPTAGVASEAAASPPVDDIVSALAAEISQRLEAEARAQESPAIIEATPPEDAASLASAFSEPPRAAAQDPGPAWPESSPEVDAAPVPRFAADATAPVQEPEAVPRAEAAQTAPLDLAQPERELEPIVEAPRTRPPRHPDWPEEDEIGEASSGRRSVRPIVAWSLVVLALFGIGWAVGSMQGGSGPVEARRPSALVLFLRRLGLAPQRYEVAVTSRPPGAWIAIDGKDLSIRTPATLELAPGEHKVELSFGELGNAPYLVRGAKNDRVALEAPMWGSLDVVAADARAMVDVALDGQALGAVPVRLDSIAPGAHDLRFSAPGVDAWATTIEVRVGERKEVLAYPLQSPATGLLQVRATQNAGGGSAPLDGARVWVDGVARGATPLTLELTRGPHSVRVSYQKEDAPVQVIDLPGGNQRFATFDFGLRSDMPSIVLKAPAMFTLEEPALVSATLNEMGVADVREMWLHVRTPENRWRRYPMTLLDAQGSVVGAAPFPLSLFGTSGEQLFYVSAMTAQGDEIFTEMQTARGPKPR